jgi:iron complex outermembrane receptor protein
MKEAENIRTEFRIFGKLGTLLFISVLLCFLWLAPITAAMTDDEDGQSDDSLIGMNIEELMEVHVRPTATLTKTSRKITPAATTIITKKDIENSGARSLDELLDIYVPNLQILLHVWETQHLGLRGSNSDRDDKYLLLVNGQVMNDRVHYGALSERDLPMLGDINRVEVVRGPGSALYGPGALYMVINIITDTPLTFEGTEVKSSLGAVDEFYSWEAKWGKRFKDDSGVLLYAGAAKQPGTSPDDAPFTPGRNFSYRGNNFSGTEPMNFYNFAGYNAAWRDLCKLKFYGQYVKKDLDFWFRFTRGGNHYPQNPAALNNDYLLQGEGYQQMTFFIGDKLNVSKTVNVDYSFSYDTFDFERAMGPTIFSHRQDEYHTRAILNWNPHENHSIAIGGEYSHEEFGLKSPGYPDIPADSYAFSSNHRTMPRWSTDTSSVLGEYQWKVFPKWTIFLGGRADWHRFVGKMMFSPRGALVYTPTDKDTLKFIIQRSTRVSTAENMKLNYDLAHPNPLSRELSGFEKMDYYEMRWERQHTNNLWLGVSGYYTSHQVIAWKSTSGSGGTYAVSPLGRLEIVGVEGEATYKTDKAKYTLSHGYSKLVNMKLKDSDTVTFLTSEPQGYGCDLANWSNHVSKLTAHYDATKKLSLDGSLNIYWGFPGKRENAEFRDQRFPSPDRYTDGFDAPFRHNIYLNLGMGYKFSDNCRVHFMAHNILGWLDDDYNKRNYGFGEAEAGYTTLAPSVSVTLTYRF